MIREELKPAVQELIAGRRWADLRDAVKDWQAADLADLMLNLDKTDRVLLFRVLRRPTSAEVFAHMEPHERDTLLLDLTDGEVRSLLASLAPDDRTELLEELPGQVTQRLLNLLSPHDLREARTLLGYPDESVGRLMTPDYVAIRTEWTIERALVQVRRRGRDSETINRIYVVDAQWRLVDDISLRRLILAEPDEKVEQVMDHSFVTVSAFADREEAVRLIQRYDLVALPVVDSGGVLLGIVTIDDVLDVVEEETTEDFHKVASVRPFRTGYWETTIWTLYRLRIGWLAALVAVSLISSGVIAAFEEMLATVVALAFFMPLIIGTGGNAGTQSATIMIRAISTGDVQLGQWGRAVLRELGLGLGIGVSLGVLGLILGVFRGGPEMGLNLGLVVFVTMAIMLTLTNLMGMTLPFLLVRLNLDPAVASGPLVTSIADAVGLLIYFSVASAILL